MSIYPQPSKLESILVKRCVHTQASPEINHMWMQNWASLVAQIVKNPPAMWETWIRSLGWEDALEEGMATQSSILVWRIPMDRGALWVTTHRGHKDSDTTERLSTAQPQLNSFT